MREGFFKKEAKLMLWLFVMIPVMGIAAAVVVPHLKRHQKCLKYEPEVVQLNGQLKEAVYPGPPNYESVKEGDLPETSWILHLPVPICVEGNPKDDLNAETERYVKEVQLVVQNYKKYESLVEKNIAAKGKLMHSHTGHHHTKVLLQVDDMTATTN